MGYDVHITRAEEWSESERSPITLEEWKALVGSDPELRMDGFAETTTPDGGVLRIEGEGLTVWTGHSRAEKVWFSYRRGKINVKNPGEEVLSKMRAIAQKLGAHVQGDEGELYDEPPPQSWWSRLFKK